jgi:hypothetical protein
LNSKLQDFYQDSKYIIRNAPDRTIPVNHLVWAPNNPRAQQIVFDSDPIRKVEGALFRAQFARSLAAIHEACEDMAQQADKSKQQSLEVSSMNGGASM